MSQSMPVALPASEAAATAGRRAPAAEVNGDAFGATLRDQMPGAARTPAAAAPDKDASHVDHELPAAAHAARAAASQSLPEAAEHPAGMAAELAQALAAELGADPAAALGLALPVQDPAHTAPAINAVAGSAAAAAQFVAGQPSMAQGGEPLSARGMPGRGRGAADAVRVGMRAAVSAAASSRGDAQALAAPAALDLLAGATQQPALAESALRSADAALRPVAASVQPSPVLSAIAPLAAALSMDRAPRMEMLPPVMPPVGDPQWGAALGARLVWSVARGTHSASITLNPRELGPVNVSLTLNDEEARVSFQSHHVAVRDAIEAALPRLRELFADGGLVLGEVDISAGDGRSGAHRDPAPEQQRGAAQRDDASGERTGAARVRLAEGLVDTFA